MTKLTFVLVTCGKDIPLAIRSCLKSVVKLFKREDIMEVLIITRKNDMAKCKQMLNKWIGAPFRKLIRVVNEANVCSRGKMITYQYQMALKLAVAKLVKTTWFITLDSDVYLTKRINASHLINGAGKARINYEPCSCHAEWWNHSNKTVKTKVPEKGLGVTPAILHKGVCLALLKKHNIVQSFQKNGGTEYTMYWLFLIANYNKNNLYQLDDWHPVYHKCIWGPNQITGPLKNHIAEQFADNDTIFSLVQSNTRINYETIINIVNANVAKVK